MDSTALLRPLPSTFLLHRPLSVRPPSSAIFPTHRPSPSLLRRRSASLPPCHLAKHNPRQRSLLSITRASSSSPSPPSPPSQPRAGAKPLPLAISVAIGLIIRFLVPKPVEVTSQAWQLLAIFLSTIAGLVLSPLPVGAWAFICLTVSVITNTLSFSAAFGAFTNEVIWLIVISFFFARGFVKTGLGDRIATYFVKWLGRSTLGLSYGLTVSEALISPAMPSTTARAGGVFLPIINSLSMSSGSRPGEKSSKKLGSYLVMSQFQVLSSLWHFFDLYFTEQIR